MKINTPLKNETKNIHPSKQTRLSKMKGMIRKSKEFANLTHTHYFKYEKNNNANLIKVEKLSKSFGDKIIFDDINFEIKKGQRVAILGKNGVGKSTLINILCETELPSGGKVIKNYKNKEEFIFNLGVQFQGAEYPNGLKVKSLIDFYQNIYKKTDTEITEMIDYFHLKLLLNTSIKKLSGGQKQRLNIFLSVIHNPTFLILDELSTGLDLGARTKIRKIISEIVEKNNLTLCLITHNVEEISALCDHIILLSKDKKRIARVKEDATIAQINKKYGSIEKFINTHFQEGY